MCYYNQIVGTWTRGIIHGKRIEYRMNLDVFPIGYYAGLQKDKPIKNFHIVFEMKKGIANGPATINCND